MMFPSSAILLSLLPFTYAATHVIEVGNGGLVFNPDNLTAAVGDMLEFQFYPEDHSVAQGSFSQPCQPLNSSAFYSGFMPVSSGVGSKMFTVMVNDTNPIWFYCSQVSHCQGGMVGVVNPPSNDSMTLAMYKNASSSATTKSPPEIQGGVIAAVVSASSMASASMSSMSSMSSMMSSTATMATSGSATVMSGTASPSATATAKTGEGMRNKTAAWGTLAAGLLAALFSSQMI